MYSGRKFAVFVHIIVQLIIIINAIPYHHHHHSKNPPPKNEQALTAEDEQITAEEERGKPSSRGLFPGKMVVAVLLQIAMKKEKKKRAV